MTPFRIAVSLFFWSVLYKREINEIMNTGVDRNDEIDMILRHVQAIRKISWFEDSELIVYIETNYGGAQTAKTIFDGIKPLGRIHAAKLSTAKTKNKHAIVPGVFTTHDDKERAAVNITELMRASKIRFLQHVVTENKEGLEFLFKQIQGLKYRVKEQKDEWGNPKYEISGKGEGKQDDCAIGFLLVCLHGAVFISNKENEYRFKGWKARPHVSIAIARLLAEEGRVMFV